MDFSKMLHEILDIIAEKHIIFYEDYLSFALVCKSWHSSALYVATKRYKYSNGPPSRLPSLLLSEKEEDEEFRELFLLSNESIHKIRLPEAYGKFCMSSCGWLVTVGEDHVAKLVNPLSREIINLPNIDTFLLWEWKTDIRKLVFLPQSSLVVIISGFLATDLEFCRIGDDRWTSVDYGSPAQIYDITYYRGRVYSFDHNHNIKVCDVFGEYPKTMVTLSKLPDYFYDNRILGAYILEAYILGLDDDDGRRRLLVVIREGRNHKKGCSTKCFKIFEFDFENEKWSKVKDLGRKTLFVGYNSSFWIEDTTGVIKGNCIYYTGHIFYFDLYRHERDMGIYHLSDGTIEPHFIGESRIILTPPIWLQSNTHY